MSRSRQRATARIAVQTALLPQTAARLPVVPGFLPVNLQPENRENGSTMRFARPSSRLPLPLGDHANGGPTPTVHSRDCSAMTAYASYADTPRAPGVRTSARRRSNSGFGARLPANCVQPLPRRQHACVAAQANAGSRRVTRDGLSSQERDHWRGEIRSRQSILCGAFRSQAAADIASVRT